LETGELVWDSPFEAEEPEPLRSAPVLAGEALLIVDRGGDVFGLDPEAGTLKWSAPAALEKTVLSNPLVVGEEVLISAQGGDLFSVDPATGRFSPVETP
jgi:outer membrane protein assembly factor BamB